MSEAVTFSPLNPAWNDKVKAVFKGHSDGFVQGAPGQFLIPPRFLKLKHKIRNMEVRESDTWIVTYPKCGTTWTQELLWLINNNCDFDRATKESVMKRIFFIEFNGLMTDNMYDTMMAVHNDALYTGMSIEDIEATPRDCPRIIKTHLPIYLLPQDLITKCKVVYVARNPRDVLVSYYHHSKLIKVHGFEGEFSEFFDFFINNKVCYSPYWEHIFEGYQYRKHPNFCFLFFEDMKKDFLSVVQKVATFLDKQLSSEKISEIEDFLKFDNCKKRWQNHEEFIKNSGGFSKEGSFYRKGAVGDYVNHFTPEMEARMVEWEREHLKDVDFKFPDI